MLVLSATFSVKPGMESALTQRVGVLLPLSRQESGCLRYDFLQDAITPGRFVFLEVWKSHQDLQDHFQKSYFKSFTELLPTLIAGKPDIVTYETEGPVPAF